MCLARFLLCSFPLILLQFDLMSQQRTVSAPVRSLRPHNQFPEQIFKVERFTIEDGLSQNLIYCILQDARGLMLFGTKGGLNMFDGHRFLVYRHDPANANSLSNNYVTTLLQDRSGYLWIGTALAGLNRFDPTTDTWTRFTHDRDDTTTLSHGRIRSLCEGRNGSLWVGTQKGLNRLHMHTGTVERITTDQRLSDREVLSIFEADDGVVWVGTPNGLLLFTPPTTKELQTNGTVQTLSERFPALAEFEPEAAIKAFRDRKGTMWLILRTRLVKLSPNGRPDSIYTLYDDQGKKLILFSCVEDLYGQFWVNAGFRLFEFNPTTGSVVRFPLEHRISDVYVDRSGVVWIGTGGWGIYHFDPKSRRFQNYSLSIVEVLYGDALQELRQRYPRTYTTLYARSVTEGDDGTLWLVPSEGPFFLFDPRRRGAERLKAITHPFRELSLVYKDRSGRIWIGIENGIAMYEPTNNSFVVHHLTAHVQLTRDFYNLTGSHLITAVFQDRLGYFWVGTTMLGLVRYHPETKEVQNFRFNPDDTTSISSDFILCVDEDPKQPDRYLWIGTDGGGLNRLDLSTQTFQRLREYHGLPNNIVYGLLPDKQGFLWLSTNRGLCRLDPTTITFRCFDTYDGLQSNEFNRREYYAATDGRLFFGGVNGCNGFLPEHIIDNPFPPTVVLTDFQLFNRSVPYGTPESPLAKPITATKSITLNYRDNMFTIEFAALEFSASVKNQYAYRLDGFDEEWNYAGTNRTATYTNLDPGSYLFRVKASNNDGVWSDEEARLTITIVPPFWMTWWFRGAVVVALLAAFGATIRYFELRKIRERMRELEHQTALERERVRISRDMHDDIGSQLTNISLMSDLASKRTDNPAHMQQTLQDMADSARSIIASFDELVWAVNPRNDTLDSMIDYLGEYAARYIEKTGMQCHIDLPAVETRIPVCSEVRHNLFMVVKEALNNAAKYSGAKNIWVEFRYQDSTLSVGVYDDGHGFRVSEVPRFSNGLAHMRQRMEDIRGGFSLDSTPGEGTRLYFSVKIG